MGPERTTSYDPSMGSQESTRATFGDRPRAPRPVLLTIVFGVLLAIVGVTATAQAVMVSVYASTTALQANVESDLATIRGFVHQGLDQRILTDPEPAARRPRSAGAPPRNHSQQGPDPGGRASAAGWLGGGCQ